MRRQWTQILSLAAVASLNLLMAGCPDPDPGAGTPDADNGTTVDTTTGDVSADDGFTPWTPGGDDGTVTITEPEPLAIQTVTPARGKSSGFEQVEIIGTGFASGVVVYFGESQAQETFVLDDTRLAVLTPPRIPGLADIRVIDPIAEAEAILEDAYLFYNPVGVVAVDPPSGHVLGGDAVTIYGSGFRAESQVLFGGKGAINIEVIDDGTILAVTPDASGSGPVTVHVSNDIGIGVLPEGYLYYDSPKITAVSPAVGPTAGGNTVEIRGQGFVEPLAVSFGGLSLVDLDVSGPNRMTATVPAGAAGTVDALISTTFGAGALTNAYTFLDDMTPGDTVEILTVTPASGPSTGGNLVTIVAKGLTFLGDTTVRIGGVVAPTKSVDAVNHAAVVEAPPGALGTVDVTLANSNGEATLPAAYTYESFVAVYEVMPNFGPTAGGTTVTISGAGFVEGAQVRIGALPASSVHVIGATSISATTPPGSPGLANVTVQQGGLSDTLFGGFSYQAPMDLWVVDPPQGSQAGGTLVNLYGSGFPADAKCFFGDKPGTHIKLTSTTTVQCKTPPNTVGTVDVEVRSASAGTVALPLSFTYYDPESLYGGTWGQEIDGAVNVSVISATDGAGIPDAFVMLWINPDTPYQGFTNQSGQITFSGEDLLGDQMVSASKDGYASASVVEYNATNVTLYMTPTSPPSSGPPPPSVTAPVFKGQVVNLTKYVPIPWGKCANKVSTPGGECGACTTNTDCTVPGFTCNAIPNEGNFCTSHCTENTDCSPGYICYPLNGVSEHQCVPQAGIVTAYCDTTKPTIFSQDRAWPPLDEPRPGLQVNEDFTFEMTLPIGEVAVFCWGGILSDLGVFEPYALGVKRHVLALPGEVYEHNIILNHQLDAELTVRLDNPPADGIGEPDFNYMFVHLDLGSDGTIMFLDDAFELSGPTLVKTHVPKELTGDLYDATYTMMAGSFSFTDDNMPYSVVLKQGIKDPKDDTIYEWDGSGWKARASGITQNLNDIWAKSDDDMLGVGSDGLIVTSIGASWAGQPSGVSAHLKGVHGVGTGEAIAVGEDGTATFFDGTTWNPMITGTTADFEDVWMAAADDAFAVGWYTVQRWDGQAWAPMFGNTSKNLSGVFGFSPSDVWAVGFYGQAIHYDGSIWSNIVTNTTLGLRAAWGATPDDLFIVGEGGTILHWDGTELTPMESGTTETLESVWGAAGDDVYAVGASGSILRYDGTQWLNESPPGYTATFLAVAGHDGRIVASGTHELLFGPLLAIPKNIEPTDGGTMGDEYLIRWDLEPGPDAHFSYVQVAVPSLFGPVPEWTIVNDWNVQDVLLPDFPNIEGTPGIGPGNKVLTIMRVYKEGFDIDNYSNLDFNQLNWNAWSQDSTTFTK